MWNVVGCGKTAALLKGKRDREYERVLHSEQERFLSEKQNLHEYLEEKPGELFKVNAWLRERLSEAEFKMGQEKWW